MTVRAFVSYRRTDTSHVTGRFRDRLSDVLSEENVFYDVESVPFGADFRRVIQETIDMVDVVFVLIGPEWQPNRLHDLTDYVRLELSEALRQDKLIVPVLVDGTEMPSPELLPEELSALAFRNAAPLRRDPDFRRDAERIIDGLRQTLDFTAPSSRPNTLAARRPPTIGDDLAASDTLVPDPHHGGLKAYVSSDTTGSYFEIIISSDALRWIVSYSAEFRLTTTTLEGASVKNEHLNWSRDDIASFTRKTWKVAEFDLTGEPSERRRHARLAVLQSRLFFVKPAAFLLTVDDEILIAHGPEPPSDLFR